jgi:hypothetical protein
MSAIRSTLCSAALVASLLVACSAKTDNPPTATQGGLAPGGAGGGSGGTAGGDDAGSGSGGEAGTSVPDGGICNSTTCSGGCCSTSGCQAGNLPAACGIGGVVCTVCNANLSQSCVGGTCY